MTVDSATVEYHFPESVEDASGLMQQYNERARFIARGTDLLLLMERQHYHPEALIDLTLIEALHRLDRHHDPGTEPTRLRQIDLLDHVGALYPRAASLPGPRRSRE